VGLKKGVEWPLGLSERGETALVSTSGVDWEYRRLTAPGTKKDARVIQGEGKNALGKVP